ncbi:hypothetical protein GCM10027047_35740 [Rhodococcus aerolatus]
MSRTPAPPHHGEPPSIPLLGTTWYRRGAAYRVRRVLITVGFTLLAAFAVFVAVAVVTGVLEAAGPTARVVVVVVLVLGVSASLVSAYRWRRAYWAGPSRPLGAPRSRQGAAGIGLGPIAVLGAPFVVGHLLAVVLNTLGHYVTVEERDAARRWRPPD